MHIYIHITTTTSHLYYICSQEIFPNEPEDWIEEKDDLIVILPENVTTYITQCQSKFFTEFFLVIYNSRHSRFHART